VVESRLTGEADGLGNVVCCVVEEFGAVVIVEFGGVGGNVVGRKG